MDDLPDATFTCLFYYHDNLVTVKHDGKEGSVSLCAKSVVRVFRVKSIVRLALGCGILLG